MDPGDILRVTILAAVAVVFLGVALDVDTSAAVSGIVNLGTSLAIGAIPGTIAGAIAAAITRRLPPALLFGGATTAVVALIVELWIF